MRGEDTLTLILVPFTPAWLGLLIGMIAGFELSLTLSLMAILVSTSTTLYIVSWISKHERNEKAARSRVS